MGKTAHNLLDFCKNQVNLYVYIGHEKLNKYQILVNIIILIIISKDLLLRITKFVSVPN